MTQTEPALPAGRRTVLPRPAWLLVWASALVALAVVASVLPGALHEVMRRECGDLWLVLATAIGIAISQSLIESQLVKRLFNVSQHVLSVAAAAAVSSALITLIRQRQPFGVVVEEASSGRFNPTLTLVWVLAMATFFLVNHSMVAAVVSLSTGEGFGHCWRRAAPVTIAGWAASTAYGLVIAALLVHDRALLPLLVVPIGLSYIGNRAWARSLEQGQRMHSLYAAGRALSNQLGDTDVWHEFVAQVAGVLNCDGAAVFLGRPEDGALDVISTGGRHDRLVVSASPTAWEQAAKGCITRSRWPRSAMVMMEADGRVVGYAVAYGPRMEADFTSDHRGTLLTLANQGAAALLNESLYREAESERAALRDIVGHSTDGIYTVGPDRTVRSWNPAMKALTGYTEDEAVGQKCFNLLRARDTEGVDMCAADCPILAAAKSGREEVRDASVLNKDGVARWIHYAHAPIVGAGGEMESDVVVVRDVTRERQTDELKADFVASVSHELRTPLTPIKGFLMTLLREDRDFTQDRRHEYYKLMLVQSQRLERLIEDLLEV